MLGFTEHRRAHIVLTRAWPEIGTLQTLFEDEVASEQVFCSTCNRSSCMQYIMTKDTGISTTWQDGMTVVSRCCSSTFYPLRFFLYGETRGYGVTSCATCTVCL